MMLVSAILTVLVAVLHFYFLVLEMFLWTRPAGMRAFGQTPERARETAVLAANQGLYNGFLAAGLVWSLVYPDARAALDIRLFFLGCVVAAGLYGAWTVSRKVLIIQALPAAFAAMATLLAR
jgi:putative membrane protein